MRLLVCVLLAVCVAWVSAGTPPMKRLQTSLLEKSAAAGSADFAQAVFQASDLLHTERVISPEEQQRNMEESFIDAAAEKIENEAKFRNSPEHKRAVALVEKLHAAGIDSSFVETASQSKSKSTPVTEELASETRSFLQHSSEAEMDAAAQQELLADMMAESKQAMETSDHSEMAAEVDEAEEFLKKGAHHFDDLIEKGVMVQADQVTNELRYADFPGNWGIAHQVDSLDNAVGAEDAVFLQAPISTDDSVLLETFQQAEEPTTVTGAAFEDAVFNANELLHFEAQEHGDSHYLDSPIDAAADRVMVEVQHESDPAYWHAAQLVKKLSDAGVADNEAADNEASVFLNTNLETQDTTFIQVDAEAEAEVEAEAEAEAETEVDAEAEGETAVEAEAEGEAEGETTTESKAAVSFSAAIKSAGELLPASERPHTLEDTSVDKEADAVTQDFLEHQGIRGWSVAEYSNRFGHEGEAHAKDDTVFLGMTAQMSADATANPAGKKPMRKLPNVAFSNPSFAPYGHAYSTNANGKVVRDYAGYALPNNAQTNTKASQVLSEPKL